MTAIDTAVTESSGPGVDVGTDGSVVEVVVGTLGTGVVVTGKLGRGVLVRFTIGVAGAGVVVDVKFTAGVVVKVTLVTFPLLFVLASPPLPSARRITRRAQPRTGITEQPEHRMG